MLLPMKTPNSPVKAMLPYSCPDIRPADLERHNALLFAGQIDPAEVTEEFEALIAQRLAVPPKYVIATGSATAALELAYRFFRRIAIRLPFFTWASTYSPLAPSYRRWYGTVPIVARNDFPSCHFDPTVLVELWGRRLLKIFTPPPSSRIILDAAQNLFDPLHGAALRSPLDITVIYSFGPIKQITCGRGGAIISKRFADPVIRQRALAYLDSGTIGRNRVLAVGRNLQISDPASSLGIAQLLRFDVMQDHRQRLLRIYREALRGLLVTTPDDYSGHIAVLHCDSPRQRDRIAEQLADASYATGVHYRLIGQRIGREVEGFRDDLNLSERVLTIPCHCRMTEATAKHITEVIQRAL